VDHVGKAHEKKEEEKEKGGELNLLM